MAAIGVLTLELHIEDAHSLKDKRSVVKGLKDRLRARFNVSVAEIGGLDSWQSATVAIVTVSGDRTRAAQVLDAAERAAEDVAQGCIAASAIEWIE